jgi:hypothetical protein
MANEKRGESVVVNKCLQMEKRSFLELLSKTCVVLDSLKRLLDLFIFNSRSSSSPLNSSLLVCACVLVFSCYSST